MKEIYYSILILHIIGGTVALVSGGIAFTVRKAKGWHTKSGITFYYAMLLMGVSAIILCVLKFNPFLLIVGLFSLYMAITGYRSIRLSADKPVSLQTDWFVWRLTLCVMLFYLLVYLQSANTGMAPVLMVFSTILLLMLILDFKFLKKKQTRNRQQLLRRHISRMGGAYIATVTAFFVTNVHLEPAFISWLLPTAIGTPAIIYFQNKYTGKKKSGKAA